MINATPQSRETSHRLGRPRGAIQRNGKARRVDRAAMKLNAKGFAAALAHRLRFLMDEADVAASELAAAVGSSTACVMAWRAGRSTPSIWMMLVIAQALGCSLVDLMPDEAHLP